jgi:hypothetical protein
MPDMAVTVATAALVWALSLAEQALLAVPEVSAVFRHMVG